MAAIKLLKYEYCNTCVYHDFIEKKKLRKLVGTVVKCVKVDNQNEEEKQDGSDDDNMDMDIDIGSEMENEGEV